MHFPVYVWGIHPHLLFEAMGYAVAFAIFLWLRATRGDTVEVPLRWSVIAAAFVGGALGSKALYWAEDPAATAAHWREFTYLMRGKTIIGGLIGGGRGGGGVPVPGGGALVPGGGGGMGLQIIPIPSPPR